jgi:hypothetical protein
MIVQFCWEEGEYLEYLCRLCGFNNCHYDSYGSCCVICYSLNDRYT